MPIREPLYFDDWIKWKQQKRSTYLFLFDFLDVLLQYNRPQSVSSLFGIHHYRVNTQGGCFTYGWRDGGWISIPTE